MSEHANFCELYRKVRVVPCISLNPHIGSFSFQVTSPYGNNLHHIENVTHGQFAFTTTESGNYLACFWIDGEHKEGVGATLSLDWRTGIAARDWDSVARKEKIEVTSLKALFAGFFK